MLIIDAHLDLAWNALQWDRDLIKSVYTTRTLEAGTPGKGRSLGTVAFPEMRKGGIGLCFGTLLARCTGTPVGGLDYSLPAQAYGAAQGQLACYKALESQGHVRLIRDLESLERHVDEWEAALAGDDPATVNPLPIGIVISMESADPILYPAQLGEWYGAGVRAIGMAHYGPGRYAGGTGSEAGLTQMGREMLTEMERLGVIMDLTHFSDRSFWEAIERFGGTVIASHNNCRALVPHQRQFDDDQLLAIIERDGVIGAALDTWMLQPGWIRNVTTNEKVVLANVVDHIDHICQLAGDTRHVALGTDLDGGFGKEQSPRDLDTISDLQRLEGMLAERGYTENDVAAILHGNWLRLLRRAWSDEVVEQGVV